MTKAEDENENEKCCGKCDDSLEKEKNIDFYTTIVAEANRIHLLKENQELRTLLQEVQKYLAWLGNDCSSLTSKELSEKITKKLAS